jgi:hypothetical protein
MQRKDWLPSFLTFYLTFPTLNIISKYFSNIVILIRFADVELPCRYAVIKSLLLLLLLLLLQCSSVSKYDEMSDYSMMRGWGLRGLNNFC